MTQEGQNTSQDAEIIRLKSQLERITNQVKHNAAACHAAYELAAELIKIASTDIRGLDMISRDTVVKLVMDWHAKATKNPSLPIQSSDQADQPLLEMSWHEFADRQEPYCINVSPKDAYFAGWHAKSSIRTMELPQATEQQLAASALSAFEAAHVERFGRNLLSDKTSDRQYKNQDVRQAFRSFKSGAVWGAMTAQTTPDGYQLVPTEASNKELLAGIAAMNENANLPTITMIEEVRTAMLQASSTH